MGLVWDTVWPLWSVPVDGSPLSLCWRSDLVANVEKPYSIPFMCLVARERERSPWLTPLQIGMDTVSVTVSISVLQVKRCATCFSHNWLVSSMVWLSGLLHWPYIRSYLSLRFQVGGLSSVPPRCFSSLFPSILYSASVFFSFPLPVYTVFL